MALAVVRSISSPRQLTGPEGVAEFEQELVDQYLLAEVGAGLSDGTIDRHRQAIFDFVRFLGRPIWEAAPADADRYLATLRSGRGLARSTVQQRAWTLAGFFDFLIARYQGDIHALTGVVVGQPIDEFNRPTKAGYEALRVPPTEDEVTAFFAAWGASLPDARKYLTAARDYMAASLWRRVGLRINETRILDMRDWHPELGQFGKLHVRHGKGSYGRGPKPRMVAAINAVDSLMEWWLTDVRHQFGPDWADPDAPLFPSERQIGGVHTRVGDEALRTGFAHAVQIWLPSWAGRLTPHGLRHFCASSLYLSGVDLKAIQELLGHDWLSTTTRYIHVHDEHVETVWRQVNAQTAARIAGVGPEASCGGI